MSTISNSQSDIHTDNLGHASMKWEGLQRYSKDDYHQYFLSNIPLVNYQSILGIVIPVYPSPISEKQPSYSFFQANTVKHVRGVRKLHQCATEASKRATGQIQQALLRSANYRTAWPVKPLSYSQMYHFFCRFW